MNVAPIGHLAPNHHSTVDANTKRSSITGKPKQTVSAEPIKTFDIVRTSESTWNNFELQRDGYTVLWTSLHTETLQAPVITMRAKMEDGPIVAGARLTLGTSNIDVILGDPTTAPPEDFITVGHEGRLKPTYTFAGVGVGEGRDFQWRKTHQKELGSSKSASNDLKLIDPRDNDNIVAAYICDKGTLPGEILAHVDFYVDCEYDFELETLITIVGVAERRRREAVNSKDKEAGSGFFLAASSGLGLLSGAQ